MKREDIRMTKIKLSQLFLENRCACGNDKEPGYWLCPSCWEEKRNTKEWISAKRYCNRHIVSVRSVIEDIKRQNKGK